MAGKRTLMQVTVERLSPVLVELAVEVEADRVRTELSRAYRDLGKTARVSGFRPGKAPRAVLSQVYGGRIRADVARSLVDSTYGEAVSKEQFQAVGEPTIEPSKVSEGKPFSYKARIEVLPKIEKVNYEGLEVKRPSTKVTSELVDQELERLRVANSTLEPVSESTQAAAGDVATLDFAVRVGDEELTDAAATDLDVELGEGRLIQEIEDAVIGKKAGEQAEATVAMPETHPHPQMKGQTVVFGITVKDVKRRKLPELDDEFAKDLGDFENLDQLKKSLEEDIQARLKEQSENKVAERLVLELVKANEIEVPPSLVRRQSQMTHQEMAAAARQRGERFQLTEEIHQGVEKDSVVKVTAGLLMAEIAKQQKIEIGDAEIEEGLKELAEQTGKNIAKLRAEYRPPQQREMLVGMILENKVLDIIESKAKIEDES